VRGLRDYNDAFEKNKGKKEIIQILTQSTRIKDPAIYQAVAPVGLSPDGLVNTQSLKADAQWYYQQGYLKAMPDIDTIVDLSYARTAAKKLGRYP
jgi:NitT/TauT family transport system substrate-binding protein